MKILNKQTKISKKLQENKEHLKSTIIYKSKEKNLQKQVKLCEENQTMINQIKHFENAEKRYKNIFTVIDQKEKKIQESYRNLKPGCKNLALAEVERDRSFEDIFSKQHQQIKKTRDEFDTKVMTKKQKDINDFKNFNEFNLNVKNQKNFNHDFNQK
mmetsp:Transcript_6240/g.5363  ORF Transcript_6240/g.5363 Transcript_6240/m.5363 type:complete len:157 (-) Transcript_6240:243-713(-)